MMDAFECILDRGGGSQLIHSCPDAFVDELLATDSDSLGRAVREWCKTEELMCTPRDVQPVVDSLLRLANRARSTGNKLYLWNSL
jgi:hypothetical protein